MNCYIVSRLLTLSAGNQHKTLQPATNFDTPATSEVNISSQSEIELLHTALRDAFPEQPIEKLIRILPHESVAMASGLPVMLGVHAFKNPDEAITENCLSMQVQALTSATPWRRHYRLLLINAFGSNLGDNLIGLTAFRQVLTVLQSELPSVSIDVMLGWHKGDGLSRLFRDDEFVDTILTQGLTLAELTRYQALFDTSSLLYLPRYGKMPLVDWYLWWMGVTSESVPAHCKRNSIAIPDVATEYIAAHLPPAVGPRILINPKASVMLRCQPEQATVRLVEYILTALPDVEVILIQPLPIEHPRVVSLSGLIPTVDHLAALVAQVDGLIGVDTYTQHLADATSTPSVTLFTSVEPDLYPYYPLSEAVLLPGARQLPGWGKMKVTDRNWASMSVAYEAAWNSLDPGDVVDALHRVMALKMSVPEHFSPRLLPLRIPAPPLLTRSVPLQESNIQVPLRQRDDPLPIIFNRAIVNLAKQAVCTGDTAVLLGAGAGEVALELAGAVGHHGRLVLFEPRRELHLMLCANLAYAGICNAETHAVMPDGERFAVKVINRLRISDEYSPLDLSNCDETESVICWPLDSLSLKACQLLVVCSPLPLLSVLRGGGDTIERLRPVVLSGILRMQDVEVMKALFTGMNYRVNTLKLGSSNIDTEAPWYGILIAEPAGNFAPSSGDDTVGCVGY
jgi:hypothetical protein